MRRALHRRYGRAFRPRHPRQSGASHKQAWMRAFHDEVQRLNPDVYVKVRWDDAQYLYDQRVDPLQAAARLHGSKGAG